MNIKIVLSGGSTITLQRPLSEIVEKFDAVGQALPAMADHLSILIDRDEVELDLPVKDLRSIELCTTGGSQIRRYTR